MKTRECPSCAMEVDSTAEICPICGYEFTGYSSSTKWIAVLLVLLMILFMIYNFF